MRFMTQAMIYAMVLTKVTVGVVLDGGAMLTSAFDCLLFTFCPHILSFSQALNAYLRPAKCACMHACCWHCILH